MANTNYTHNRVVKIISKHKCLINYWLFFSVISIIDFPIRIKLFKNQTIIIILVRY